MEDFLAKNPKITLNDFTTIENSFKYSLRFELGDEFPNGTKKRVRQAKRRALEIFEEWFISESEIIALTYEWEDEMFARTPNYIYEILKENRPTKLETLALMHSEDEEIEYSNGMRGEFKVNKGSINWGQVFKAIANTEMGFTPTCHQIVYLFGKSSNTLFWMYDDRGCMIMSNEITDLDNSFKKFNNWLVEGYREEFNKLKKNYT